MFEDRKNKKKQPEGRSLSQAFAQGGNGGKSGGDSNGDNSKNKDLDLSKAGYSSNLEQYRKKYQQQSETQSNSLTKKQTQQP